MIQTVQLDKLEIILDSEKVYSGKDNPSDEDKLVRKAVGLPVKKQLVYFPDKSDPESAVKVVKYQLVEMYEISDRWYTIEITTEDNKSIRIHSDFLAEMQKPSFFSDLSNQKE